MTNVTQDIPPEVAAGYERIVPLAGVRENIRQEQIQLQQKLQDQQNQQQEIPTPPKYSNADFNNNSLFSIGLPPSIFEFDEIDATYNNFIRTSMRVVDIIPLYFSINTSDLYKKSNESQLNRLITLDYEKGITEFKRKLAGIGFSNDISSDNKYLGARCWVTSSSNVNENIRNEYGENKFIELWNSILEKSKKASDFFHSLNGINVDPRVAGVGGIAAALLDSKQLSLPKIWQSTDYKPEVSFTIKLTSPYGNENSFYTNIAKPLIYLITLLSPSSYDGITYGLPPYFTIKAYGSMFIDIGVVTNIAINRGGGESRFNANKQPLEIDITLSFENALPGFAAMIGGGRSGMRVNDVSTMGDILNVKNSMSSDNISVETVIPGIVTVGTMIKSLLATDPSVKNTDIENFNVVTSNQSNTVRRPTEQDFKFRYGNTNTNVNPLMNQDHGMNIDSMVEDFRQSIFSYTSD